METRTVVAILKGHPDTWSGPPPYMMAVAQDKESAKEWISIEVQNGQYATGMSVDDWIRRGYFILEEVEFRQKKEEPRVWVLDPNGYMKEMQNEGMACEMAENYPNLIHFFASISFE